MTAQMKQAVADLVQAYGRLDIVFANAGINGVWAPIDELQPDEWDRTIAINLRGTYLTLHHAVPHLKKAGRLDRRHRLDQRHAHLHERRRDGLFRHQGRAGGDGADAGGGTRQAQDPRERGLPRQDRHGDHGQYREAAHGGSGGPAEFHEGRIPLTGDEPGTSDEVAELVLFLASDRARHITGTPVWIDGAQSLVVSELTGLASDPKVLALFHPMRYAPPAACPRGSSARERRSPFPPLEAKRAAGCDRRPRSPSEPGRR